jgi:predicted O-methyltransferase YrrM
MCTMDSLIRRASQLLREFEQSPRTSAALAAVIAAAIGRRAASPRASLVAGALASGFLAWSYRDAFHRLERSIRSAEDAALLGASLGSAAPVFGRWSAEGDFAGMIVRELEGMPELVVECGTGATTLIIAHKLRQNGSGHLVSFEHDLAYAARIRQVLARANLLGVASVVEAPLRPQQFGDRLVQWYDRSVVHEAVAGRIEILIVDGPPQISPWARWPALEVFFPLLAKNAVVLVDDGRSRATTRAVRAWNERFPELEVYWLDTVKGTWFLKHGAGSEMHGRLLQLARLLHPRPAGFGRWPVHR